MIINFLLLLGEGVHRLTQEEAGRLQDVVKHKVLDQHGVLVVDDGVQTVKVEHLYQVVVAHHQ